MSARAVAYRKRAQEVRQNFAAADQRLEALAANIAKAYDSLAAQTDWIESEFSPPVTITSADSPEAEAQPAI
jgi:2'-5' RNA ligase